MRGYIILMVYFERRDKNGLWLARCEELGTAIQAHSLEEAEQTIRAAIEMQLDALEEEGERERFFKENNIQVFRTKPRDPILVKLPENPNTLIQPFVHPVMAVA